MSAQHTYVVIMAGGIGSRFWPSSRTDKPKQFLDILGVGKTLLQLTYDRFLPICSSERILVVTNDRYRDLVQEQLPDLPASNILCEPSRNNTAPCIAYAALYIQRLDPQACFVVAPSDHLILKEDLFRDHLRRALDFAYSNAALVTMGIQPTSPHTGYGYICFAPSEQAVCKVQSFTEKPDSATAQQFLLAGNYLWNAGIFIWRVDQILGALERYAPAILEILREGQPLYGSPEGEAFIQTHYPQTPNISIDYAVMEKADNIYTLPADIGWSDLGTWGALYQESEKDDEGNVINVPNRDLVLLWEAKDCLVRTPENKLVIIKDLQGYIVVDDSDVLLIYPKAKEQEIKQVNQEIEHRFGAKYS